MKNFEKFNKEKSKNDNAQKAEKTEQEIKEKEEKAQKNWKRGHLGVTAEDYRAIGGSPDIELRQNPGKTLGELWSMDKIREKLEKGVAFLEKARKNYKKEYEGDPRYPDNRWYRDDIISEKNELRATVSYLKSIGKLPKEFDNFEVEDLENDPSEV